MNSIFSHLITFLSGLIVGVLGNYYAARLSDKAKNKDLIKERKKKFQEIKTKMPKLINEMIEDLKNPDMKDCREFFISPSKSVVFNTSRPTFFYYENEHSNLRSNIRILEQEGFVFDITEGNSPKYQFSEEFVGILK
jgi:hypothetical protein